MLYQKLKKTVLLTGYSYNKLLRNSKQNKHQKKAGTKMRSHVCTCLQPVNRGESATEFSCLLKT